MASVSPGTMSGPPRRTAKPTATTKAYRFEGFTKRIAKIKIDPVHTVPKTRVNEDPEDLSSSYFRSSLDEWSELNLSATFTSFLNKVQPLSESLPQILHHADKIFDLLYTHIDKQDVLALEPLLGLVAHLAHDLGVSFQKYFERTVEVVTRAASVVDDAAIIEHAFSCLTWMFKYLSKVMVQDLRLVLRTMSDSFISKKDYIRRFAAESLAFLFRKAAILYGKNPDPLRAAVGYLFETVGNMERDQALYQDSVMTLLVETAVSIDAQLYSSAVDLFRCVFDVFAINDSTSASGLVVLNGAIIGIIHRTNAKGFEPLLTLINAVANEPRDTNGTKEIMIASILFDVLGTRKGSRVLDWKSTIGSILTLSYATTDSSSSGPGKLPVKLICAALLTQYCPMDQLLPFSVRIVDDIARNVTPRDFYIFCELIAEIDQQRFRDLVLPQLQRYLSTHWTKNEDNAIFLLQQLSAMSAISQRDGQPGFLAYPKQWEDHVVQLLTSSGHYSDLPKDMAKYFKIYEAVQFPVQKRSQIALHSHLKGLLDSALAGKNDDADWGTRLILGWGFSFFNSLSNVLTEENNAPIADKVLRCRPEYFQLVPFLDCTLDVLSRTEQLLPASNELEATIAVLCQNLLGESVALKTASLRLLHRLGEKSKDEWLTETCSLLLDLLQIPYIPSNTREISMLIRRLPKKQESCVAESCFRNLVPLCALGLLRVYYDQTRKDLCIAIGQMVVNGGAEELVLSIITQWLQKVGLQEQASSVPSKNERPAPLSPFECSNYQMIQKSAGDITQRQISAESHLIDQFEKAHTLLQPTSPADCRVLALDVLLEIPEIAEKRFRVLSPIFLSSQQGSHNHFVPQSNASMSSHTLSPDINESPWSFQERRSFLSLIGKFMNPRVLYRSREVHEELLNILTNGSSVLRGLALQAYFNWKDPIVAQYKDILTSIAEERYPTTELALALGNHEDTKSIKIGDREAVLPILLRLLFGQLVGRTGAPGSQESRRKSILRLLFRMEEHEIRLFLEIALGPLKQVSFSQADKVSMAIFDRDIVSQDQQYGFVKMVISMQDTLESQFLPYGKVVVDAVVYCTTRSYRSSVPSLANEAISARATALTGYIRRAGLQCLTTIFETCTDITWAPYLGPIFSDIIEPRTANMTSEQSQDVTGLFRLFSVWSKSSHLLDLLLRDRKVSQGIWGVLGWHLTKDNVKMFISEYILANLLDQAASHDGDANPAKDILSGDIDFILQSFATILQQNPSKHLLLATTKVLQPLAPYASSHASTKEVIDLLVTLLCEPAQRIPPHVKGQLLSAMESLFCNFDDSGMEDTKSKVYPVVAGLFNYFKDRPNRTTLCKLLVVLAAGMDEFKLATHLCEELNATSTKSLEEIDYERQLSAYAKINSLAADEMSPQAWTPVLHNLLFFARTADDFAIRSNAVSCLKTFLINSCNSHNLDARDIVLNLLLPALRKGIREDSELIRADFVAMYGLVVKHLPDEPNLADMRVLLVGDDEEASFFTNILHIQLHRRLRAIRRLLSEVQSGAIKAQNISDFFLPLLGKFIDDQQDDENTQGAKGHSIAAMSILLQWVHWKSFRALLRKYRTEISGGGRSEKETIKLLDNAADALSAVLELRQLNSTEASVTPVLLTTLPTAEILGVELKSNLIPKLAQFIHLKDEAEISLRIPAAKVAVKLIKCLPPAEIQLMVTPIILDISQILRSRTQESRDISRNTLAEIVRLLGPSSLQFVLKQMRTTLTRGYQLHVLSYALHTILLQSAEGRKSGDLDYCVEDIVAVVMDDIFGAVGQEKESQDYISSMKEVKSSKSQDSMELLAKSVGIKCLSKLVKPFQTLLQGSLTNKQIRQVDELLRRIGVGISHNPNASSQALLVFSYEMIQDFYKQKSGVQEKPLTNDEINRQRFLIQMKSASETSSSASTSLQYKLAKFALDIVRSTLSKNTSLMTAENLHGFLPIIGDALVEAQDDVRVSAFRLLSTIIRLPLPDLDSNAIMYIAEAVKVVKGSVSTSEESPQAALKLITAILRDRSDVQARDADIAYLLHRITPDIEEPDRQGVTFNFIKAVMMRQYQLPEVYELVDKTASMMVTNQSRNGRDVARGVYVHFLVEYPQSKNRWTKQLRFLVKNLEYESKEGRQSVMEAIHSLLHKVKGEEVENIVSSFFLPITLRIANDDDAGCREMAGALLAQLFTLPDQSSSQLLDPLRQWISQDDNLLLKKLSMQAWNVFFDTAPMDAQAEVPLILTAVSGILKNNRSDEYDWEIQYQALELFTKINSVYPGMTMTSKRARLWADIRRQITSPHVWNQIAATRLIGVFITTCMKEDDDLSIPLSCKHGLHFDDKALVALLRDLVRLLKRNEGNVDLAQETLKNITNLSRIVENSTLRVETKVSTEPTDNEEIDIGGVGDGDGTESESDNTALKITFIPAVEYLLDQLILILRKEPSKLTTAAFTPKLSALSLLNHIIPSLSPDSLPDSKLISLLTPLNHITDPSVQTPRSADESFLVTYQTYVESAHSLQEAIQKRVGNQLYVKLMTEVAKIVRERRSQRKMKRAIDRVADPETAAREKQRKKEMKMRRKKVVVDIHRKRRRKDLGF